MSVTLNKASFEREEVPYEELSMLFPITLYCDVAGVKGTIDYDDEIKQFLLDIDGEHYEDF